MRVNVLSEGCSDVVKVFFITWQFFQGTHFLMGETKAGETRWENISVCKLNVLASLYPSHCLYFSQIPAFPLVSIFLLDNFGKLNF